MQVVVTATLTTREWQSDCFFVAKLPAVHIPYMTEKNRNRQERAKTGGGGGGGVSCSAHLTEFGLINVPNQAKFA